MLICDKIQCEIDRRQDRGKWLTHPSHGSNRDQWTPRRRIRIEMSCFFARVLLFLSVTKLPKTELSYRNLYSFIDHTTVKTVLSILLSYESKINIKYPSFSLWEFSKTSSKYSETLFPSHLSMFLVRPNRSDSVVLLFCIRVQFSW